MSDKQLSKQVLAHLSVVPLQTGINWDYGMDK